ncbi:MAG: NADP-dependent oxidoreductase [Archangium sp.]|nr:NADP-dependent oxidoreductase [Archangium sp.]MDP3158269.1 NADP-dependent oxidoreductase [Archangium sp.]MDP3569845.1 NADP-dependent oxidoreductase [Archangium sp.]
MSSYRVVELMRFGGPQVLTVGARPFLPLAPGDVRVRALASAVNHSDLHVRSGDWKIRKASPFPYVPGLEVVGEAVEVGSEVTRVRVGDRVWTTMQGLGGVRAEREGGYSEFVTVNEEVLALLPPKLDPVRFAAIGLAGVTALESLRRVGDVAGKTVLVTGATGGVGAVAVDIAKAHGATVIAQTRTSTLPTAGSVDAVLDGVAGPAFPALVAALRPGGCYCAYGAAAGGDVRFDLWNLLERRVLTGYSSEDLSGEGLRAATAELLALSLPSPPTTSMPLEEASRAHALLERREVRGRIILVP